MENRINNSNSLSNVIQRRDIWFTDLGQNMGSMQNGIRPCLIISNDVGNRHSPCCIIVPLTSSTTKRPLPTHVSINRDANNNLEKNSIVLLEQIITVDKRKLIDKIGKCSFEVMAKIDKAIKISLAINDVNVESVNNYRNNLAPLKFDTDRAKDLGIAINKIENIINTSESNLIDLEDTIKVLLYELKFYCSGFENINYRFFYKPIPRITKHELAQKLG